MQIQIKISPNFLHILHIKEGKQLLHELKTIQLWKGYRWYPKLEELEVLSLYSEFVRILCKTKIYPTKEQIDAIFREQAEGRLRVLDIFFRRDLLCGSRLRLNEEEKDFLARVVENLLSIFLMNLRGYCVNEVFDLVSIPLS